MEHTTRRRGTTTAPDCAGHPGDPFAGWARLLRGVRAVVTGAVLCAVLGGGVYVWWTWELDPPAQGANSEVTSSGEESQPGPAPQPVEVAGEVGLDGSAREVVMAWDESRERAWGSGDAEALEGLYADGSSAGSADVAALREWKAAGWRVRDVAPRLLAVHEVKRDGRRLVVDVTDRFDGAVASRSGDGASQPLPAGTPRTRRVSFVWSSGSWLVSRVSELAAEPQPRSR